MATRTSDISGDAKEQIARLRSQVEGLMRDRASPALNDAAERAEKFARSAGDAAQDQAEALSEHVRGQPLLAIVAAAAIGFAVGRLVR